MPPGFLPRERYGQLERVMFFRRWLKSRKVWGASDVRGVPCGGSRQPVQVASPLSRLDD